DVGYSDLATHPQSAPPYSALTGALMQVPGYFDGSAILAGTAFGQIASGIRPDDAYYPGLDAFVLDDGHGNNRYPPIAGTDGANALSAHEVQTIEQQALTIANRARAQIRNPLGSQARVTVSIVDTNGVALAIARTRDAPVFGIDVSLQKARTAAFNSGSYAADALQALAPANYFADSIDVPNKKAAFTTVAQSRIGDYVSAVRTFLGMPDALTGSVAFTDRAGGNLSRPFFPDGVDGNPNGPFSHPYAQWSPFQEGLQLDLVYNAIALNLVGYLQAEGFAISADNVPAATQYCTASPRLANGIQVFPGSVPIYRGNVMVGGLGVSGDGVDQDDMVSFLGLYNAGVALNGTIGNAPTAIRADNLAPQGVHLRYVECPQAPFLDSNADNVCDGK
ncbi:MAG: heme-binding protein, partial [Rudaea sp.]